jgi:hypothetical protein
MRGGVQVELERRSVLPGEVFARVQDELQASNRAREGLVRERGREPCALSDGHPDRADGLDVEVAAPRVEVADSGGSEQPHPNQPLPELSVEPSNKLGEMARDPTAEVRAHDLRCVLP